MADGNGYLLRYAEAISMDQQIKGIRHRALEAVLNGEYALLSTAI
jgi:hypothetical protein